MSVHEYLLHRGSAKRQANAVTVQFQAEGGGSPVAVPAIVGPESVEEVQRGEVRELMRMLTVEYQVSDIASCRVERDKFVIDAEAWTVNRVTIGGVSGFAELVRPMRAEKAGRGRLER